MYTSELCLLAGGGTYPCCRALDIEAGYGKGVIFSTPVSNRMIQGVENKHRSRDSQMVNLLNNKLKGASSRFGG
jgi:hypothetical protein